MKILYLTDQTYLHGGIEKVLSLKANYLAERANDEVFIVTYNQKSRKPVYDFSDKIIFLDLGINYAEGVSYFHPSNLKKIPKHRKRLQNILKKIEPDVVVNCSFGPDFHFIPHISPKIPKIKEFHSSRFFQADRPHSLKDRWMAAHNARAEKKYDQLVVLNPDELPFYHSDRISVIPNPCEPQIFNADVSSRKVLAAGRIAPVKNFDGLVEIWNSVHHSYPDWELHIYGEDYLGTRSLIDMKIKKLGLEKSIKFKGTVENLPETMKDYSLYLMTSHTECFPMVLLEAKSVGMPVISYNCPTGPGHIIKHGEDGFLVSDKNAEEFSQQLLLLMENENLRHEMSRNAKLNSRHFDIEAVMQKWKELLVNLTGHD